MNGTQQERTLKRIRDELRFKYKDEPNGDIRAADEFKVYLNMWQSHIPLKYWEREISDITDPNVRRKVEHYVENLSKALRKGIGIYFHGNQGTGKTLAACLILKEAIRRGYKAYFTMLTEVIEKYCDGRYDREARAAFARHILEADLLVLDDIDKGYISDKSTFIDSAYDYVLRTRSNNNLPIIFTSNMKKEQFTTQKELSFGSSMFSLLTEHSKDIHVYGQDRRKTIKQELEDFFQ
jgi:DNA replication protein DnaC